MSVTVSEAVDGVVGPRTYTDAEWAVRNPPAPAPTAAGLLAYAADLRYRREVGGITVEGVPVATDDRSKLLLAGARIKAESDPSYTTQWKASLTHRVTVSASQIVAMSDAVLAWVDRTFAAFDTVAEAIAAQTVTSRAEVEAALAAALV